MSKHSGDSESAIMGMSAAARSAGLQTSAVFEMQGCARLVGLPVKLLIVRAHGSIAQRTSCRRMRSTDGFPSK